MLVTLPESIETRLSPESIVLHLAIGLFVSEEATLGQTAEAAGIPQADFLHELGKHKIPIHYREDQPAADLKTVEELAAE